MKNKIVNVKGTCLNHVVWANKSITDIGSQLWNENLIYRGILYITDFLNEDSTIMNYNQFCVNWDLDVSEITSIGTMLTSKWQYVVSIVPQYLIGI